MKRIIITVFVVFGLIFFISTPRLDKQAILSLFDPLTKDELQSTVSIIKTKFPNMLFSTVALYEPNKYQPQNRKAFVVLFDFINNKTYEVIVDLQTEQMSVNHIIDVQPALMDVEYERVDEIVRTNELWQQAMKRRGIKKLDDVKIDTWAPGYIASHSNTRLVRTLSFLKSGDSAYCQPIEGVIVMVDLNKNCVIDVADTHVRPISKTIASFTSNESIYSHDRPSLSKSFKITGHRIEWNNWRFQYALHPREGLILYKIGFNDNGKLRSIMHRASLSEMLVPYGDPDTNWVWRNAFDEGEYGIGKLTNSLRAGLDVPNGAALLDADFTNDVGDIYTINNAVAVYERDGGLLWKHTEDNKTYSQWGRELIIGHTTTIGNYDYGFNWVFRQDGSIEVQVLLTGIMLAKSTEDSSCASCNNNDTGDQTYGTLVAENIVAPNHQHFFNFRLDLDVDGPTNNAAQMFVRPADYNPNGNAFIADKKLLLTESMLQNNTKIKITSRSQNKIGHFTGYELMSGSNSSPYMLDWSTTKQRAAFISNHLWITKYNENELYAAGSYPNQRLVPDGVIKWNNNQSIVDKDIVLWYTLGVTHIPRTEDWPIMPVSTVSFKLIPNNFFDRNPLLK